MAVEVDVACVGVADVVAFCRGAAVVLGLEDLEFAVVEVIPGGGLFDRPGGVGGVGGATGAGAVQFAFLFPPGVPVEGADLLVVQAGGGGAEVVLFDEPVRVVVGGLVRRGGVGMAAGVCFLPVVAAFGGVAVQVVVVRGEGPVGEALRAGADLVGLVEPGVGGLGVDRCLVRAGHACGVEGNLEV